uniref:Uncharacterized protein n=1 Tax=viral metagenome TaxID=1070528 RepID=A0A6C0BLB9_9ZZZZ
MYMNYSYICDSEGVNPIYPNATSSMFSSSRAVNVMIESWTDSNCHSITSPEDELCDMNITRLMIITLNQLP